MATLTYSGDHKHDYASADHTHEISDILNLECRLTALETAVSSNTDTDHTHESFSITDFKQAIVDLIYPVGSIYTMDPTSPAERFGGMWAQIVDRFLYCSSSSGTTGGSSTIT